jgi:hypothetical protein
MHIIVILLAIKNKKFHVIRSLILLIVCVYIYGKTLKHWKDTL